MAGPESANNAGAQTSFIPMLTLGIPSNPVMALMIGAMIIQGIQPGTSVMTEQPALFWGIVVSMWVGNVMLLILNLPLIGLWVKMISVPYHFLYPAILVFCAIGTFSLSNSTFDVYLMAVFGFLGYLFHKFGCEPAPMMLGFILGPMMEEFLRRALLLSKGDPTILVTRPISATMLALSLVALFIVLDAGAAARKREEGLRRRRLVVPESSRSGWRPRGRRPERLPPVYRFRHDLHRRDILDRPDPNHRRQHPAVRRQRGRHRARRPLAATAPAEESRHLGQRRQQWRLRIVLTIVAVELLRLPYLKFIVGALLLWIGIQLLLPEEEGEAQAIPRPMRDFVAAIRTILIADLVMSLDNVISGRGGRQR